MLHRTLGIPNPVAYYPLAKALVDGWADVEAVIGASTYTMSAPISRTDEFRALVPGRRNEISDVRAMHRASSRFVVFADVSQWYPSVYSHAVVWALHGKAWAKKNRFSPILGNSLDKKLTALQDGQSVGIPIGPDFSLALGELVLSACDADLARALNGTSIKGFRYYDDYELYAGSRSDADRALVELQRVLATYELSLNTYKVDVKELPVPIEDDWVSAIKQINVRSAPSSERSDLLLLFDEAFRQAKKHPGHPVLKYALGRFVSGGFEWRQRVSAENWLLFQRLILQTALAEPGTLDRVASLLAWEKVKGRVLDEPTVSDALNLLIGERARSGDSSEVAWGVYAARKLGVKIQEAVARSVSQIGDDVVALTTLDARNRGIIGSGLDTSLWQSWMTADDLYGEHWLTAYEAFEHGWLVSTPDYINIDPGFAHLRANKVRFYNEKRHLQPKANVGVLRTNVARAAPTTGAVAEVVRTGLAGRVRGAAEVFAYLGTEEDEAGEESPYE